MAKVVVVGGGPAGCALAVSAAMSGHDIVLLDEGRRLKSWPGESVPSGGGALISSVFGPRVLDGHAPAFGTAAAWGSAELVAHDFMAHWAGQGYHLDRQAFDASLRGAASDAGVEVRAQRFTDLAGAPGSWRVNDGVTAEWIVDASGRAGVVLARLGIPRVRVDQQVALVGVVPDRGGGRVTTVESVREGWWYTTPIPRERRVAALVTDADLLGRDRAAVWKASLGRTAFISGIAGDGHDIDVQAYPADTTYRQDLVGEGWLAVGDAAVSFDPLSSQGLITGIVMAARAGALLGGDLLGWEADYRAVLAEHEANRRALYSAEGRFLDEAFWRRRVG